MKKTSSRESALIVRNLRIRIETKEIVRGINLHINPAELHVIMGPNGSGKSTLTYGLMGSPGYVTSADSLKIGTEELKDLAPEERAQKGLLLAFQNPIAVPGVTLSNLLRTAYREMHPQEKFSPLAFHTALKQKAELLGFPDQFLKRAINDGFSGGEKKKAEMLQLLALQPKFVMLDEIDTGLDVDALKLVSLAINELQKTGTGILLITHYQRILNYVHPDFVHVLKKGEFVKEGGAELVTFIEEQGYGSI